MGDIIAIESIRSPLQGEFKTTSVMLSISVAATAVFLILFIGNARLQVLVHEHTAELLQYRDHLEDLVKERTAELETTQEKLLRSERLAALGQLTATVAHEIRNPLGTIRNSIFSLGETLSCDQPERAQRALKMAERNIKRCDGIITELLDFSRKKALQLQPTQIDPWLKEILDEFNLPQGLEFTAHLNSRVELPIDREQLRRAVDNIIHNAIQALQNDQAAANQLRVETQVVPDRLQIRIIDTGPGIPPDIMDKIFEPLFSTGGFGAGLGLPIVKHIMEEHNGGIEYHSQTGQGTTAVLWLPLQ